MMEAKSQLGMWSLPQEGIPIQVTESWPRALPGAPEAHR